MTARTEDLLAPGLHGAFVREGLGMAPPSVPMSDALAGLRLAAKDVFEVAGQRMGAGNPVWLAQQQPARRTALVVQAMLDAGAAWIGKTVTDELAFSLAGVNAHYGTPENPASADRIPGGSSSGSAVAVAAGHADVALATDCGGSARLPASHCGIWGMRPTQGRIAGRGVFSLAHSFDTVGWFARDGGDMARVFAVLAHADVPGVLPARYVVAEDALLACDPPVRDAFHKMLRTLGERLPGLVEVPGAETVAAFRAGVPADVPEQPEWLNPLVFAVLPAGSLPLSDWASAHRALQGAEIWQQHGRWVTQFGASLAEDVRARFAAAATVTPQQVTAQQRVRIDAGATLARLLDGTRTLLLLPTTPGAAPRRGTPAAAMETWRQGAQQLQCIAGLAGLPQVTLPWIELDGAPVGLSVIGPRGADAAVLQAARHLDVVLDAARRAGQAG